MGDIDYNATAADLGLGDVFSFEEHSERHTVQEASLSVDGSVVHVWYTDGGRDTLVTYWRIFLIERAPSCPCGVRFEHCDNECVWPDALWIAAGF